ncbi:MAG: hypothetical protein LBS14_04025 [Holosporaceae bacterium]|jgi:hypothetical protein|nr:hypothetical protein [Holosporaceae bacterium]
MSEFSRDYVTDFNDIGANPDEFIPVGTIASVRMTVRNGGYGPDCFLAKSRGTGALYLNAMLIVTEGPYILRRIFHRFGVYSDEPGNEWVEKGLRQLRAALESARNISPKDISDLAKDQRKVDGYKDFDGLEFLIKVGIETPKNPQYKTANCIQCIITPDMKEYAKHKESQSMPGTWPLLKRG